MNVSSSTLCLFLTTGHMSHFLAYMPRPTLSPRGFFSAYLLLRPAPFFRAWLFQHSLAPAPRPTLGGVAFSALIFSCAPPRSFGRGFFRHFPLLCPVCLESCRLCNLIGSLHAEKRVKFKFVNQRLLARSFNQIFYFLSIFSIDATSSRFTVSNFPL